MSNERSTQKELRNFQENDNSRCQKCHRICLSCGRVGHRLDDNDGQRIGRRIQANTVCWRCQLQQRRSVP
ncbi:hypothetical protein TNCV_4988411 [Trichonephila clavipes]|nr:hypothetical protein TNCV_4988411 [Trichonephila clavipes]